MKKLNLIFLACLSYSQTLNPSDISLNNLVSVVESASRNGQRVLVDDFTGLDCPPCNWASLTVLDMLDQFPETLISLQWHLSAFTPEQYDFNNCLLYGLPAGPDGAFVARANLYGWDDINSIPIEVFNGTEVLVGADPGDWAYTTYTPIYYEQVGSYSPYEIEINGIFNNLSLYYEVTASLDSTFDTQNHYLYTFLVEDNILSLWQSGAYNARNVVRDWVSTLALDINESGENQIFSENTNLDTTLWNADNIKIISVIQDASTSQVFQVQQKNINEFDYDQDGIIGNEDNCPGTPNPGQEDSDNDHLGDACDICDNANIWVNSNINGEIDTNQVYTVDIYDLLTLSDIISSGNSETCGYQISDVNSDGTTNLLDIFQLIALIMQG